MNSNKNVCSLIFATTVLAILYGLFWHNQPAKERNRAREDDNQPQGNTNSRINETKHLKTQKQRNPQALIGSNRHFSTLALLAGLLFGLAVSGLAADRNVLDQRIRNLADRFEAVQANPGKRISPEVLRKAQGIILLDGTRAGFLFAYEHASGVAMVKDSRTGEWGPASFLGANEASQGLQIGGVRSLTV